MAYIEQVTANTPDGATIGKDSTIKAGFHGVAVVQRPTAASQAALTLTTTTSSSPVGFVVASAAVALFAQVEEIRATLVAKGIMAGA